MKLEDLAHSIAARWLEEGNDRQAEIGQVFAGDRMSALLEHADSTTLLVTGLNNPQLAHVAELMDCPGICLLDDVEPEPTLLQAASRAGTTVLVSPFAMFETCGRLYRCLERGGDPRS